MGWGEAGYIGKADQDCGDNNGRKEEGESKSEPLAEGNDGYSKAGIGANSSIPGSAMALKRERLAPGLSCEARPLHIRRGRR